MLPNDSLRVLSSCSNRCDKALNSPRVLFGDPPTSTALGNDADDEVDVVVVVVVVDVV